MGSAVRNGTEPSPKHCKNGIFDCRTGGREEREGVFQQAGSFLIQLKKIWADGAYSGEELARWCKEQGGWELEIVERYREVKGFEVLSKRGIVERTFSWLIRNRRLSKDYERSVQTSETLIEVATMRLILRRPARTA